jgi:RTX calcium-binding nonapeptide repeat (4 copies)
MATITGTDGNDELVSQANGDVVNGLGGNDTLEAGHNNVTLNGDDPDNTLVSGDDSLTSYGNNNVLNGGPGNDSLNVGDPVLNNILNGDDGDDTLTGNFYSDTLNGGADNDLLVGNQGDDVLNGDGGDDRLLGGGGKDTLNGGAGNDELVGGADADDVFQFSFALDQAPGDPQTLKFTDWLSEKYGKDFGDQLPDFERGHDHHHGKHEHDHGKHGDHYGKSDHYDGRSNHHHQHHASHHDHHHHHGGCDDHQSQHHGLSQSFFSENYSEWLREVVVPDLQAQGLAQDTNGNGKIDICLNQNDPNGTPRIEGLTDEQLSKIFGDRDEVTLQHGHHEHDAWYSNSYTSSSSGGETTVVSNDGFDTIIDFNFVEGDGGDQLEFDGITQEQFLASFVVDDTQDLNSDGTLDTLMTIDGSADWSVTLLGVSGHDLDAFANDSMFS